MTAPRVAAIVPCHNEETAVATVVKDLHDAIPDAVVYVYDNASTDRTAEVAAAAGAVVRHEARRGKGEVIRRAFADVDADVYVMVDGDDTYDATVAGDLVEAMLSGPFDHVVGIRVPEHATAFRAGHELGNRAFNRVVSNIFGTEVTDMMSGYRVFSRRFVKSFPASSRAFEIETELTVHAVQTRVPQLEVPVGFRDRPAGSVSKLNTYRDGFRILRMIARLLHHERPLTVYTVLASLLALLSLVLGVPVIIEYADTGLVPRLPTAILAASTMLLSVLTLQIGVQLDGLRKVRQEATRIAYLSYPAPGR